MKRWVCPRCGKGALAPERPRKDDARRFCLACSAQTGRMVERVSPALERERAEAKERTAAKSAAKSAKARDAERERRSIGGFDLDAEAKRLWKLPTLREAQKIGRSSQMPTIEIRRTTRAALRRTAGHAKLYRRHIVLTLGTNAGDALETLEHELMHIALQEGHTPRFWSFCRSLAKEAWPEARFSWRRDGWQTSDAISRGIDELIGRRIAGGELMA